MTVDFERFRIRLEEERGRVRDAIDNLHSVHPGSMEDEARSPRSTTIWPRRPR